MTPLMLALMPVLVILTFRTLCTLTAPPVPTYLERSRAETLEEWWQTEKRG
jgi:hypothetical protein